jgi:hypothetical protein
MATERIIIEFVGDTTELEPAIDQLEALGKIDKKSADAFRATNKAILDRKKELDSLSASQSKQSKQVAETTNKYEQLSKALQKANQTLLKGASSEMIQGFYEGIGDALDEAGISADVFTDKLKANAIEAEKPVVSLRTQLRKMKDELATLDPNSARFKQLAAEAGEVEDKMGDIALQVRNLASDTSQLDGLIQGVQGVAGAFQVAQGAAVLFGEENEDFQKTLLQLTALLNISNGLQQVQLLLQKQSAAVTTITNAQKSLQNLLLVAENGLQSKNVIVKGAATVAQYALNAAMTANPAGILVVALGALAGALLFFTRSADDATESQEELTAAQIKANETILEGIKARVAFNNSLDSQSKQNIKALEQELELSKLTGDNKVEQAKIEKQIADQRVAASAAQIELNSRDLKSRQKLYETEQLLLKAIADAKDLNADDSGLKSRLAITQEQIATLDAVTDAYDDALIAQAAAEKAITDAVKDESDKRLEARKKEAEAIKAANLRRLEEEKAAIETRIILAKSGSIEEQKAQLDLIDKEIEISLTQLDGVEGVEEQKNLIRQKGLKEAEKLTRDGEARIAKVFIDTQQSLITAASNRNEKALLEVEKNTQAEVDIKNRGLELQAQSQRLAAIQTFELSEKSLTDAELLASELELIDANLNDKKKQNAQDYADFLTDQNERIKAEQQAVNDQIEAGIMQVISAVSQAYFTADKQRRDESTNLQIKTLNDQKNRELANKRLTDQQKLDIEEKYRKQEAEIKRRAWEADKNAKLLQAGINVALGITAALATGPPAGYVLAAITAALGAIEIAAIASTQAPAFAKGVEFVEGPGTGTSDSIAARLSRGERVITAKTNADYFPALSAIHSGAVPPALANSLLTDGYYPNITRDLADKSVDKFSGGMQLDYDKLGKAVSDNLWSDIDNLNDSVQMTAKIMDSVPERITKGLNTEKRNRRYYR